MRIKSFLFSTLALAAGLLTIYSCTAELEQYPQRGPVTEEADFLVITENPVTKTVFDGEHTLWAENDKISAINIEDGGDEYYASSMTYRGDNRFGGRVTYAGDVNNWYLIYPYRADNVTPKETHIHIPEVQVQNGNDDMSHIAGEGFPLIGKELGVSRNNQLQVTMRNVLARLDFKVTNTAGSAMVFKQVVFTAPDNVCGDFVGDITNDTPSWTAQPGAFKNLTLNIENGTPVANGELAQFHAGIAPLRIPANGSIKAKVVAVSPSAPENEIVFYHIFNIINGTTLRSGTSYGFNMSFDTAHSVDPTPDEPIIENQVISFDQENVTWQLGAGYSTGVPYDVQTLNGAHTSVDYVSSNTNVATIDGAKIYIVGPGNTTITANAREENGYSGATASYELTVLAASTPSGTVYVKASSLTVGGTYLIVDHQDQRLFKGSTDGSYVSVSPVNGVITDSNNSLSNYEFTITQSNDAYCIIFNDNRYLVCDYSSNSSAGLRYESSKPAAQYLYSLTINNNGAFEFSTSQMNSTSTHEVLYYKSSSDLFKIGGSGSGIGVHLYLKDSSTPGKQPQTLSFSQSSVTETMATASGTLEVQHVSGAQTDVDYTSSNTNVATVSGTTLYIHGFGRTTITANAVESNVYSSASVSYELTIAQGGSTPTGPRTYTYVAPGSLEPGTYVIAGSETNELSVALFPSVGTGSWNSQTTGQVNNGQYVPHKVVGSNNSVSSFTTEDSEIFNSEVVLAKSGNNWTIQVKSTGQYLVVPTQEYRISFVGSSSATAFEISNGMNGATVRSGSYYFYHSGSAGGFTFRTNSTSNIRFYQSSSSGSISDKQPQTLSFSQSSVTETMATASGTLEVQHVSGAQTDVDYTSSNTNVATVSGTTLYIHGFGRTTITANAVESNVYSSASVSYELIIAQGGSTPTGPRTYTYVAPGSLEPGTYVIAGSETNELSVALFPSVGTGSWNSQTTGQVNNGQYVPHKVVGSNNSVSSFTTEDSEIFNSEVVLAKSGNNWTIQVKSTGQYLVVPTQEYRISFVGSSSATAFEISNGTNGATVRSGSYYFYHSGSASGFTFRTNSTSNIRFYQSSSSGTTPTPGKQNQSLSFANGTVNWTLGSGYTVGQSYDPQSVNGAQTTVTYSIADSYSSVAQIVSGRIKINGAGTATVTATAQANDTYNSATSSYTLNILPESGVMVYNLENDHLKGYLDKVEANPYDPEVYSYTYMTSEFYGGWGEMNQNNRYDIPKPVPVSWSNPTSSNGTKVVYIYNDSAMTDLELSVTGIASNATSADVYNLIPGRMYYYKVTNSGSNWTSTGQFMTTGRRRMMKVGNGYGNNYANNCRDFGGQVTTSGKKIKYGKIYRGSNMDSTSSDAKTLLTGYMNIGLDLDLRLSGEHRNPLGVTCPTPGYNGWGTESTGLRNVNNMRTTLNAVFDAVAAGEGVYIHCAIGADRTGYVCMLLEAILGVSQGNCDVDYEITSLSCVGTKTRTGTGNYYYLSSGNEKRGVDYVNTFNGNTFQEKAIDCLVSYYGISMQTITAFQNAMLE